MLLRTVSIVSLLCAASPVLAQAPAETGTGGGPASTIYAPNTTAVGQTKPPGSAGGPENPEQDEKLSRIEKKNDAIQNGICIGCDK